MNKNGAIILLSDGLFKNQASRWLLDFIYTCITNIYLGCRLLLRFEGKSNQVARLCMQVGANILTLTSIHHVSILLKFLLQPSRKISYNKRYLDGFFIAYMFFIYFSNFFILFIIFNILLLMTNMIFATSVYVSIISSISVILSQVRLKSDLVPLFI